MRAEILQATAEARAVVEHPQLVQTQQLLQVAQVETEPHLQ
jgi:hypothetical protein